MNIRHGWRIAQRRIGGRPIPRKNFHGGEYADGFGLARPSNTTPVAVLHFGADTESAIARNQSDFRRAIEGVSPEVTMPD